MAGAGPRLQADEAAVHSADRKLRRPIPPGAGGGHGRVVPRSISNLGASLGSGIRVSSRAPAVSLLGDSGGHAAFAGQRLLAGAGRNRCGSLHSHSDLSIWGGADRGLLCAGFQLPVAAGVLRSSLRCGNAALAPLEGGGTRNRAYAGIDPLPGLSL